MSGVDMALMANDACGQPLPWEHCTPWGYFDGKLFQSKLQHTTRYRASLLELCDRQPEQVAKVEKMRQSILDGINQGHQAAPLLLLALPFATPMAPPFYSTGPPTPVRTGSFAVPSDVFLMMDLSDSSSWLLH
ncbi:hypothetical protein Y1Q_0013066 [Alligator mississippiensis]|uniref:Uncharacterized protein n=1 Tax=Alligator mississippiensis TaxID=8496 RepID=A0A151NQB0_ALLMI|nr:hypothetical protein Y1Q_0013066 [Alligator mississippiensis]